MLISRVSDDNGGEERAGEGEREDIAQDFQTANELFELMAKDHDFEATEEEPLTTRDLVLLYKNIDLGKQLMSNVNELKRKAPNQYVETVIYHDEQGSESEVSEAYSSEDLQNIVLINKERIDLLNNQESNTLCHKLGDLEIQTSKVRTEYERQFLFKNPHLQEQLKSLKLMSSSNQLNSTVLPASLLDYICCKRLEDNYNFYMDNIIKYVKNTIEQLKRISNGDYLTDKAKKKWKEVENENDGRDNASKVLTASTSIPLHVERKLTGVSTTWDDIVHSEVDLRSLAKILEKKIVLEVPKLICGSYKLFTNRLADNLIISCQHKEVTVAESVQKKAESRVDVVFQLKRSETGEVVSNIDSIMILQSNEPQKDRTEALALTYDDVEDKEEKESPKIIELLETERNSDSNPICSENEYEESREDWREHDEYGIVDSSSTNDYPISENEHIAALSVSFADTPRGALRSQRPSRQADGDDTPDDIQITIQTLNRRASLTEKMTDCTFHVKKKRSPTRVRIKSPYENKSHLMEEKKRRKLLEVRERRERRKMAMYENKISKHKNCKSAITPQASSSVTKLSITNKSFYNSIYGQNFNSDTVDPTPLVVINKAKGRKGQKTEGTIPEILLEQPEGESEREDPLEKDGRKYVNRSYYLDDAVTEMSLQMCEKTSASTSAVSNDSGTNLSLCMSPNGAEISAKALTPKSPEKLRSEQNPRQMQLDIPIGALGKVPTNTPKDPPSVQHEKPAETVPSTVECRRSIEKIYMLMKKLGKIDSQGSKKGAPSVMDLTSSGGRASSELQTTHSDSGTSLKHRVPSSNPSSFNFERPMAEGLPTQLSSDRPVEPKVIISSKEKPDADKLKKEHKRTAVSPRVRTIPDNPLKAISQLLHEFDNVQKTRQKSVAESKSCNRAVATDGKPWRLDPHKRRVRIEQAAREEPPASRAGTPKARPRAGVGPEPNKTQVLVEKKKISDLIEEAKEARGEAVRGPGRLSARLDMLAQPKRAYVPARADDRPARTQSDRLARGAAAARARARRPAEPVPAPKPPQPSERAGRRRAAGASPDTRGEPRAPAAGPLMLKNKMVAVESYVKSHYGRSAAPGSVGRLSRAPLLPSDVELSSMTASTEAEESGAIGSKLHRIVHSMLARRPAPPRPSLDSMAQNVSHPDPPSTESDTEDDIFADKQIITAVETLPSKTSDEQKQEPKDPRALQAYGSAAELEMLENALYRKLSVGTFPKRLRINNLTLTPKHSLQGVMLLQSGDTTSLVLNSKLSQNFKIHTSKSSDTGLPALPLSTTHLDFRFSRLPMQIATVGYAFPSYDRQTVFERKTEEIGSNVDAMMLQNVSSELHFRPSSAGSEAYMMENKTCQCFKGIPETASFECAVQADGADFSFPPAPLADPDQTANQEFVNTVSENNVVTCTTGETEVAKITAKKSSMSIVIPKETVKKTDKAMSCEDFEEKTEIVDYTTSLDMLVGLLNEIQKITTCSSDTSNGQGFGCRERLERNSSPKSVDSGSSLMSLYVSDTEPRKGKVETPVPKTKTVSAAAMVPECTSKEVSAQFPDARDRQQASVFTEVPSRLHVFPGVVGTDSFLESVLSGPSSSRSMFALKECPAHLHSQSSIESSNSRALQVIGTNSVSVKSLVLFHSKNNAAANMQEQALICKKLVKNAVLKREKTDADDALLKRVVLFENRPQGEKMMNKCCLNAAEFDPMLKMKRDILVTMYSLLMLTVFAALSFPELLHQT